MKDLSQRPDETDLMWQLRLSNMFYAMERVIATQRQTIDLLMDNRTEFDLSADSVPMFHKRQAG